MGAFWWSVWNTVWRKRVLDSNELENTPLRRCLNRWDLTGLGLGSTLGVGVYLLVGSVGLRLAGPSVVLSFLIAAVAALFAGLCYAEFGSRIPRAGGAYIYTYVAIGELLAFLVGWNMILEGLFGPATIARGLSSCIDSLTGGAMAAWFASVVPISTPFLSPYFDIFAFTLVVSFGVLLAIGVRESTAFNNVFSIVNIIVILFIIIAGAMKAQVSNWRIPATEVLDNHGVGGFFPYGIWGTLQGAAVCFYGFVGFDVINSTGEEVSNPRRSIPITIMIVLTVVLILYESVAIVITMVVPYYLLDRVAAVATAFTYVNMDWARWLISIGAIFGILSSLFGAMFTLPRLLYSMASDGLQLHWFAKVTTSRKSPAISTVVPASIIAILAAIVELEQLILMMSIGTLVTYTAVAASIVILRYRSDFKPKTKTRTIKQVFGVGHKKPSNTSSRIVDITLFLFTCVCVAMALVAVFMVRLIVVTSVLHVTALALMVVIMLQPQVKEELPFKTPLVPLIPCLSIYVNVHFMVLINVQTWIRMIIWIAVGIPIYILFVLCYKRRANNRKDENGVVPVQIIVESPTPPATLEKSDLREKIEGYSEHVIEIQQIEIREEPLKIESLFVQRVMIEDNEEKEAKIIDLLDQVLQAEEDSYVEIINLKEINNVTEDDILSIDETLTHRKSLSELSDAGSDASLGNQVLSKYDVIVQVHREDLPKVDEDDEKSVEITDTEPKNSHIKVQEYEDATAYDVEINSRTDESGYSDTKSFNDSTEDVRDIPQRSSPFIPEPPPLPPLDENHFASPFFKKAYSIPRPHKQRSMEDEEENKPRDSINSNQSQDDGNIVFGSDRQMNFMSKLNIIFQNKIHEEDIEKDKRKRSNSTGDVVEAADFALNHERPAIFLDLKKDILSIQTSPHLRSVKTKNTKENELSPDSQDSHDRKENSDEHEVDFEMSREDLKSKLETIFATGGPKLLSPRLTKSNPPTPEELYQIENSSTESIPKLPKIEKNDTLKRQKVKFSAVLSSLRLSLNSDDNV